ncbi:MAG: L-threonylcarbamoyladenylate synthase [Nanoarchaeota archaeon]|nr:threonylcarbamoyl-AMP synthase [Nanoarchaeota archaeon]
MNTEELKKEIFAGKIFIYPTDTIYGLGCNALNKNSVQKIRDIKKRDKDKPMSIIAPSVRWIRENCIINTNIKKYIPGHYTLILRKKNTCFLSYVSKETIGIRIPLSDFTDRIRKTGVPFITTSVNLSGEKPANQIYEISSKIIKKVDFVIDNGKLSGKPSILVINGKEIKR